MKYSDSHRTIYIWEELYALYIFAEFTSVKGSMGARSNIKEGARAEYH